MRFARAAADHVRASHQASWACGPSYEACQTVRRDRSAALSSRIGQYACVWSLRRLGYAAALVTTSALFLGGVIQVSGVADGATVRSTRTVRSRPLGFSIEVPGGWSSHFDWDRPTVSFSMHSPSDMATNKEMDCAEVDRTFVAMTLSEVPSVLAGPHFLPRPDHFDKHSGSGVSAPDNHTCGFRGQVILFVENGRAFQAMLNLGADADRKRLASVYTMLNSARIEAPHP
jgi:hypothetical protein